MINTPATIPVSVPGFGAEVRDRRRAWLHRRSVVWGIAGMLAMSGFYVAVIALASGWSHLGEQIALDWYFLAPIIAGFGLQVAIMVELRAVRRMRAREATAGGAGAGSSTVGMLACCAHHLVDLAPIVGLTGAATFLASYRIPFMVAGITLNAIGVTIGLRRLHEARVPPAGNDACAIA